MKDFRSYSQSNQASGQSKSPQNAGGTGTQNQTGRDGTNNGNVEQTVNMAAMLAKAFGGKSETQIWQTILAQAEQGKRDGTLTNADLDNFYGALAPMLDGFKRQKLKSVINKLKQI